MESRSAHRRSGFFRHSAAAIARTHGDDGAYRYVRHDADRNQLWQNGFGVSLGGPAYTFVSRGLNAHLGFLAGWAMVLDYLILLIVSTVYAALTLVRIVPHVPFAARVVVLIGFTTWLNLRGMRATAKSNIILLVAMCVVRQNRKSQS